MTSLLPLLLVLSSQVLLAGDGDGKAGDKVGERAGDRGDDKPARGGITAELTDKGVTLKDDDRGLNASFDLFFQPRYTLQVSGDPDATDEDRLAGTGFRIRRLLFLSSGKITPRIDYTFRVNFAGTTEVTVLDAAGESKSYAVASPTLDDARVNVKIADPFQVAVGRFKVPYSAHFLTGTYDVAFPEVSMVSDGWKDMKLSGYAYGRDTGAAVWGTAAGKKVEYAVGVFSGDGGLSWPPKDLGYLTTARVAVNPMGEYKISDFDLKRTDFKVGIGVNGGLNSVPAFGDDGAASDTSRDGRAGADLRLGGKGLTVLLEGHVGMPVGEASTAATSNGEVVQASYVIARTPFVPALRVARIDPDMDAKDDAVTTGEVALNYLLPMPHTKKTADLTPRRKLIVAYTTGMQEGAEDLLLHQVVVGAQAGL